MRRVVSASSRRSARISSRSSGVFGFGRLELGDPLLERVDRLFERESVDCAGHCVL